MPANLVNKMKIFMDKIFTKRNSYPKSVSVTTVVIWDCSNHWEVIWGLASDQHGAILLT